jgi:hypothetical protein
VYVSSTAAADGPCAGTPAGHYPETVAYGTTDTLVWPYPIPDALVTVTYANKSTLVASPSATSCTATGAITMSRSRSNGSYAYTATLSAGTWTIWEPGWSCGPLGGTVTVGGRTAYTLAFSTSSPPKVGP